MLKIQSQNSTLEEQTESQLFFFYNYWDSLFYCPCLIFLKSEIKVDKRIVSAFDNVGNGDNKNEAEQQDVSRAEQELSNRVFNLVAFADKPRNEREAEQDGKEIEVSRFVPVEIRQVVKQRSAAHAKHGLKIRSGQRQTVGGIPLHDSLIGVESRFEQNPADNDNQHRINVFQRDKPRGRQSFLETDAFLEYQKDEKQQAPQNKRPVRAVPQTRQRPNDKQVEYQSRLGNPVSAQRNINVIAEEAA